MTHVQLQPQPQQYNMSLPNRQIGWSDKTNMLWNILAELNALTCDVACKSTTTTSSTSSTTTTSTTVPPDICIPGSIALFINASSGEIEVGDISIGPDNAFYIMGYPAPWTYSTVGNLLYPVPTDKLFVTITNVSGTSYYCRAYLNNVELPTCQEIPPFSGPIAYQFNNAEIMDPAIDCLTIIIDNNPC